MDINEQILAVLTENSRKSFQELGKQLHITGQAVSARVKRMEDEGIIRQYTIIRNDMQIVFITIFMNNSDYTRFEQKFAADPQVSQLVKVSGEGCYIMQYNYHKAEELEALLEEILHYGRYRLNQVIKRVK